MDISKFREETFYLVENLKNDIKDKHFSDIVDEDGNQYVDIVMEGGGVLGIALVGFTYVLEQAGIRFLQIGGTSAGAINALLLAALGKPHEVKSEKILKEIVRVDMNKFIDGDDDAQDVIKAWFKYRQHFSEETDSNGLLKFFFSKTGKYSFYIQALQVWDNIQDDLGLNPGDYFSGWLKRILKKEEIKTTADLYAQMTASKPIRHRKGRDIHTENPALAVIAADISTQTKAVFPKMASLYWENPDEVSPAEYVRASMSIPLFFKPYCVDNIPRSDEAMRRWKQFADYEWRLPDKCLFVDGGIMSNFPVNLFHKPYRVPNAPTFGVKLGLDNRLAGEITTPFALGTAIFESARLNLDADFIARNPDYRKLVSSIDIGNHNWLDFNMSGENKLDLFTRGAKEADRFLRTFNWEEYKKLRASIAKSFDEADTPNEMLSGDGVMNAVKTMNLNSSETRS